MLTPRQEHYVNGILSGLNPTESAQRAGYGPAYSKVAVSRVSAVPVVKQAIQTGHAELRKKAMYDVEQAVVEVDKAIKFGYERANPMSVAKLLELKAKLFGLLIERIQVEEVDLRVALEEARHRVIDITPRPCDPFDEAVAVSTPVGTQQ
jgi:phage terminase small subunit